MSDNDHDKDHALPSVLSVHEQRQMSEMRQAHRASNGSTQCSHAGDVGMKFNITIDGEEHNIVDLLYLIQIKIQEYERKYQEILDIILEKKETLE